MVKHNGEWMSIEELYLILTMSYAVSYGLGTQEVIPGRTYKDQKEIIVVGNTIAIYLEKMIENKVNGRVDDIIKKNLSSEKVENFAKDRVSRIITTESLKYYTSGIDNETVLSNLESKILLMIKNSKEFKILVKQTMKNSL